MAFNSSSRFMYSIHNVLLLVGFCSAKCWQEQVLNWQERGSYDTHWCYDSLLAAMRVRCFFLLRWLSKYMQNLLKVCCIWHVVYKIADHLIYRNYYEVKFFSLELNWSRDCLVTEYKTTYKRHSESSTSLKVSHAHDVELAPSCLLFLDLQFAMGYGLHCICFIIDDSLLTTSKNTK